MKPFLKQFVIAAICLVLSPMANAQTDFFWSFVEPYDNQDIQNADAVGDFNVGETGTIFLYYSTNGPSDADIDTAMFLDIATSSNGIVEFTAAEIFDFEVEIFCLEIIGRRWLSFQGDGVAGETGDVTDNFIDELHAIRGGEVTTFGLVDETICDNVLCDKGYVFGSNNVDAFAIGKVDFSVVGTGSVDLLASIGEGGILSGGQSIDVQFGNATINVTSVPEPGNTSLFLLALFVIARRKRQVS